MSDTILVTGASGNIGSRLVKELRQGGHRVLAATKEKSKIKEGNDKVYLDFTDKPSMVEAFKKVEKVFLLFPMVEKMVEYAKNAVEAAVEAKVKFLLRSSGAGADSQANFLMPKVQGEIDDLIVNSGIPFVITQPTSFMQNFVNFMTQDIKRGAVYLPVSNGKVGWIDVRDIARTNAAILSNPTPYLGTKITLTGPENLSYKQALNIISETIGKEVQFVDVPEEAALKAMREMGMPNFSIEMTSSLNQIIKAGYAEGTSSAVEEISGQRPISFEQFSIDNQQFWKDE